MPGIGSIGNIWNNIKEIDLRPIRQEALEIAGIALVGAPGSGREALAGQMRRDPSRPSEETQTPVLVLDLENAHQATEADLIILMLASQAQDFTRQRELARQWAKEERNVLVFVNQPSDLGEAHAYGPWVNWGQKRVVYGSVEDSHLLLNEFVPAAMELLANKHLSLGRHFPLFRVPIAHHLINETCFSNAAYTLSTGLAEIVPVFDIPLNVTDMLVLTKTQAFLVYKLGLSLGLSTRWQDYVAEFGSVLGGGFLWRQVARSLVGLIPAWGIVPKVAVAYSGTYVVGTVVLQWYLTGRHLTRQQMQGLYTQAFLRGKGVASTLIDKIPRPRLKRDKRAKGKRPALSAPSTQVCPECGRQSAADATFCQYCGHPLGEIPLKPSASPENAQSIAPDPDGSQAGQEAAGEAPPPV